MCETWCKLFKERTVGREKSESRRNKHRKMKRNGDKRGWSRVNRSWSVCLSDSVPYRSSLSWVFVKSYFQIQSVWVCSHFWLCMCVCQQPSSWTSPRAWYEVWVPATGGGPQTSGACRCECSNGGRPGAGYCVDWVCKTRYRRDPYVVSAHDPLADFDPDSWRGGTRWGCGCCSCLCECCVSVRVPGRTLLSGHWNFKLYISSKSTHTHIYKNMESLYTHTHTYIYMYTHIDCITYI